MILDSTQGRAYFRMDTPYYNGNNGKMKLNRQKKRLYMDLCALERPYDDQSYPRIEAETAAVTMIMALVKAKEYVLSYSPVHEDELQPNPDGAMRLEIVKLLHSYGEDAALADVFGEVEKRGVALCGRGMGISDAMHVAYAESCGAEFITCDDDLLRKCRRNNVTIWCGTPVDFAKKEGLL